MANKKNKVKFNICNVHYALITVGEEGTVSFGTPVPMPGAVSISMDPTGEPESFYADGIEYYVINNNQGYDGDLELALMVRVSVCTSFSSSLVFDSIVGRDAVQL